MARSKKPGPGRPKKAAKKPIEQYEHKDEQRLNNPPVGLVKPENDPDAGEKSYAFDPHLDPQLVWAGKAGSARAPRRAVQETEMSCAGAMKSHDRT